MNRLPQSIFNHICVFTSPKDIFASSRVSKLWSEYLKDEDLWKQLCRSQHPDAPLFSFSDAKAFLQQITRPLRTPSMNDFKFAVIIRKNGKKVEKLTWDGSNGPEFSWTKGFTEEDWVDEITFKAYSCEVYVLFHGKRKQYRHCIMERRDTMEDFVQFEYKDFAVEFVTDEHVTLKVYEQDNVYRSDEPSAFPNALVRELNFSLD